MYWKYLEITKQIQHLKPVQEVVLVVVVDGEVVEVTLLLRHVLHCRLTEKHILKK